MSFKRCHPERSEFIRLANELTQSKDLLLADAEQTRDSTREQQVLRLRKKFAARTSYCAQDDRALEHLAVPRKLASRTTNASAITSVRLGAAILPDFLPLRPFICYPIAAFESESVVEQLLADQLALPLVPPNPF